MIKVKLRFLVHSIKELEEVFSKSYPSVTSFKLMLLIDQINKYLEIWDKTLRTYRESMSVEAWIDPETNQETTKDNPNALLGSKIGDIELFKKEIEKLLDQEVELNFEQLLPEDLGDKHGLSPLQLLTIKDFLKC